MHLKFDSPLFTRTFMAGLVMAVVVYVATLATAETVTTPLPGSEPYENRRPLNVPQKCDGVELLQMLHSLHPHVDFAQWRQWCEAGEMQRDGKPLSGSDPPSPPGSSSGLSGSAGSWKRPSTSRLPSSPEISPACDSLKDPAGESKCRSGVGRNFARRYSVWIR